MKNDILLFAIMFVVAWMGYYVAKDRLNPTVAQSNTTAGDRTSEATTAAVNADGSRSAVATKSKSPAASKAKKTKSVDDAKSANTKKANDKIKKVLMGQVRDWNKGDLDGFMAAYWNNKALTISGGGETTFGWAMAYENYREKYPEGEMGTIEFKDLKTEMAGDEAAFVTGRFVHQLADKTVKGNFSLVMKLIFRQWKIVQDHTSVARQ